MAYLETLEILLSADCTHSTQKENADFSVFYKPFSKEKSSFFCVCGSSIYEQRMKKVICKLKHNMHNNLSAVT